MADFDSDFWHWLIVIVSLGGILILFPFIYMNRGKPPSGEAETMGHVWDDDLEEYNNPLPRWWFNMFLITLIFSLGYLALYPGLGHYKGLLNWTSTGRYDAEVESASARFDPIFSAYASTDIQTLTNDPAAMKSGERLYSNYCATCHGSDARGAKGFPNLRDHDWIYGGEPEQIKQSILKGRNAVMPPWGPVLGEEGVENVANYVISLSGRSHDAERATEGKTQFQQFCVACHQADGTGNPLLGAPNIADRIWLYGGSIESIKESIRDGRNGIMPAHEEFLGADRVHLLAAYVYSLSQDLEKE